jgi:hypothetical protein
MKLFHSLKNISLIAGIFLSHLFSSANSQRSTGGTLETKDVNNMHRQSEKTDSLPDGVTQDWLNSLTDENGRKYLLGKNRFKNRIGCNAAEVF